MSLSIWFRTHRRPLAMLCKKHLDSKSCWWLGFTRTVWVLTLPFFHWGHLLWWFVSPVRCFCSMLQLLTLESSQEENAASEKLCRLCTAHSVPCHSVVTSLRMTYQLAKFYQAGHQTAFWFFSAQGGASESFGLGFAGGGNKQSANGLWSNKNGMEQVVCMVLDPFLFWNAFVIELYLLTPIKFAHLRSKPRIPFLGSPTDPTEPAV